MRFQIGDWVLFEGYIYRIGELLGRHGELCDTQGRRRYAVHSYEYCRVGLVGIDWLPCNNFYVDVRELAQHQVPVETTAPIPLWMDKRGISHG